MKKLSDPTFTIGTLAKQAGVGVETVRYYQRRGLLAEPAAAGGYRRYDAAHLERLSFIKRAQGVGFTLEEIAELMTLNDTSDHRLVLGRVDRKTNRRLSGDAQQWLSRQRFSGNIRELRNLIERATLLADGEVIEREHLTEMADDLVAAAPSAAGGHAFCVEQPVAMEDLEQRYLNWALSRCDGNVPQLARQIGMSPRTLYRRLQAGRTG